MNDGFVLDVGCLSGQRRINDLVPCGSYRIRGHGLPLWTDAPYMNLSPRAFGYRRYVGAVYRLTPLLLVAGMLVFHVFVIVFGIANFKLGAIVTASSLRQGIYLRACEDVSPLIRHRTGILASLQS